MKIVYCLPDTYKPGGIERIVSIKANYLADKMNYDVTIVTTGQQFKKSFYSFSSKINFVDLEINYDETLSLNFFERIFQRAKKKKKHKERLSKLLFDLRADIVVSTFTHEAEFLYKIQDGSKKILEFHFFRGHKVRYANSFGFSFLTKLAYYYRGFIEENFIVNSYDQFIVLTEEDKELWKSKAKKVISIPNILPFEDAIKSDVLSKTVIAVGRLDSQKGFDRLIDIWKMISQKHPEWKLNIYGDGSSRDALVNQIKNNNLENFIQIFGSSPNILEKYRQSSVFVMTSRYEGMPMTMLEAMSVGLPCVSYSFQCGPKDIITDNVDGFIVEENDKTKFVEKLSELLGSEETRVVMGGLANKNIKRYSKDIVMGKWNELFEKLLGRGNEC